MSVGIIGMMDETDQPPTISMPPYTKVPIAQLSSTLDQPEKKCINATVTLVWPYSSVTRTLSLLLAEPDSRLRQPNGQVKAVFHDRVATRIAESHIGIGDNVCLALKGAKFLANDAGTQTAGRWDIHLDNALSIEITQSTKTPSTIIVDYNATDASSPPTTPKISSAEILGPLYQGTWTSGSPAYLKSSPSFLPHGIGHLFNLVVEEDGFVPGKGRKRPRYSLQRDDWHIVDEAFSPEDETAPLDWWEAPLDEPSGEEIISENAPQKVDSQSGNNIDIPDAPKAETSNVHGSLPQEQPSVFIKPSLKLPAEVFENQVLKSSNLSIEKSEASLQNPLRSAFPLPTDTPQLRPIPSPALPIPSPLISTQNGSQEYFSNFHNLFQLQSSPPVSLDANAGQMIPEFTPLNETSPASQPQNAEDMQLNVQQDVQEDMQQDTQLDMQQGVQQGVQQDFLSRLFGRQQPPTTSPDNATTVPNFFWPSNFGTSLSEIKQETLEPVFETSHKDSPVDFEMAGDESHDWHSEEVQSEDGAANEAEIQENQAQTQSNSGQDEGPETDNEEFRYSEDDARDFLSQYDDEERIEEVEGESEDGDDELNCSEGWEENSYEEDDSEIQSEKYSDKSEASEQPQLPRSQPEVISLDSDSDDELASKQPPLLHPLPQENRSDLRLSDMYVHSESDDDEVEVEWDVDRYSQDEPLQDERHEDYIAEDSDVSNHERVISEKEDNSSVDVLAQDQYLARHPSRESSVEEERGQTPSDVEPSAPDDEPESYTGPEAAEEPDSISLVFDEEGSVQGSLISEARDEDKFHTPAQGTITPLDEANDRHSSDSDQASKHSSAGIDEPQLLTQDLTYEATHGSQEILLEKETTILPTFDIERHISQPPLTCDSQADSESALFPLGTDDSVPNDFEHDATVAVTIESDEEENPDQSIEESSTQPILLVPENPSPNHHPLGLHSRLSDYAPLVALIDNHDALVDTIAIVHDISPVTRATSSPKDWYVTIQITDPSMAGTVLGAQIFRRYKTSLPSATEGNAILLRNFKVLSYEHSVLLVSAENSSWAVFDGSGLDANATGHPIEYGAEEHAYCSKLRKWYNDIGTSMVSDQQLQASIVRESPDRQFTPGSVVFSEAGSFDSNSRSRGSTRSPRGSRRSRKSRRITIHELRDGTRYTEVGSPSSKEDIHELRDGTVYANLCD